jgi:hypothetical protein
MNKQIKLDEGKVQRTGFSKGPTTPKPIIIPKGQSTMNNIDFSQMSVEDLQKLQEDLKNHLDNRDDLRVYKVTLFVGFPSNHDSGYLENLDVFDNYLNNELTNYINNTLLTEGVFVGDVEELEPNEFPEELKKK